MDSARPFHYFCQNFPILKYAVKDYATSLTKAHTAKQQLAFLIRCREEQVLPRSMLPEHILKLREKPFDDLDNSIISKHINNQMRNQSTLFDELRKKRHHFNSSIPADWNNILQDQCYQQMRRMVYVQLKEKHDRKLNLLIERSAWTKDSNQDCIVNLSDKQLSRDTKCALGYGLNFAITAQSNNSVEISKSFCDLEKYGDLTNENFNIVKGIIYGSMEKQSMPNVPKRFTKALKELRRDDNIHITKADKSSSVVIMNKPDYIRKMEELLSDETTYKELNRNPLENVNKAFRKKVKTLLNTNADLIKKFCPMSPSLPYMYGQIKTHKQNNPARPIISSVGSISYNLSKYLVTLLNPLIGTISNTHIKNNVDLIEKLDALNSNYDFMLVSFDVVSLFTKVPIDDLLNYLPDILENVDLPLPVDTIIELIKLCVKDCKFQFNGKFYEQKFGMAMGNPLSPVLSNLYMEIFESRILSTIIPDKVKWYRYVDDVICIWPVNEDIRIFLDSLNQLVPSIKFTMEIENNSCISFLDVMVHRCDRQFKFSVYRKPTNISAYVHYYSAHSSKTKKSVFSSMFLRALRICSPEFLDEEIKNITTTGRKLKYPERILENALKTAKKTFYGNKEKKSFITKNLLVLPYDVKFTNVINILKKFDVNVAFRNNTTVKTKLIKNSPTTQEGCVYSIPCNSCDLIYIGQTSKSLDTRIKQHKYCIRTGQQNSAVFQHLSIYDHPMNWNGAKNIVKCNNSQIRNIIESSFIKNSIERNMNLNSGLFRLDRFISKEICKRFNFLDEG